MPTATTSAPSRRAPLYPPRPAPPRLACCGCSGNPLRPGLILKKDILPASVLIDFWAVLPSLVSSNAAGGHRDGRLHRERGGWRPARTPRRDCWRACHSIPAPRRRSTARLKGWGEACRTAALLGAWSCRPGRGTARTPSCGCSGRPWRASTSAATCTPGSTSSSGAPPPPARPAGPLRRCGAAHPFRLSQPLGELGSEQGMRLFT